MTLEELQSQPFVNEFKLWCDDGFCFLCRHLENLVEPDQQMDAHNSGYEENFGQSTYWYLLSIKTLILNSQYVNWWETTDNSEEILYMTNIVLFSHQKNACEEQKQKK